MTDDRDRALIPLSSASVAKTATGPKRIISAMMEDALALGREEALAQSPRFKIGDYAWCEPDYRQILLWAEALKMTPAAVVEKLISTERSKDFANRFGRMRSLYWDWDELPLADFRCVEGLAIEQLCIYGSGPGSDNKMESREVSLSLQSLRELTLTLKWCEIQVPNHSSIPNLTKLNYSRNPDESYCGDHELNALLTNAPKLLPLNCESNMLEELDLSHTPKLTYLNCYSNLLTDLNIAATPRLTHLECGMNCITKLDLSRTPNLDFLCCLDNKISTLDLSKNNNLTYLSCSDNKLTELLLSNLSKLERLFCDKTELRQIDLSYVPNLKHLGFWRTPLVELDIRPLLFLESLRYGCGNADFQNITQLIQRPDQNF